MPQDGRTNRKLEVRAATKARLARFLFDDLPTRFIRLFLDVLFQDLQLLATDHFHVDQTVSRKQLIQPSSSTDWASGLYRLCQQDSQKP